MQERKDRLADQSVRCGRAEEFGGSGIGEQDIAFVMDPDRLVDQIDHMPVAGLAGAQALLACPQRGVAPLLLGDIDVEAADADDLSRGIAHRKLRDRHPFIFRKAGIVPFCRYGLAGVDHLAVQRLDLRRFVGGMDVPRRLAAQRAVEMSVDPLALAIVEDIDALDVLHIHGDRRILGKAGEHRFAGAQSRARLPALPIDVHPDADR